MIVSFLIEHLPAVFLTAGLLLLAVGALRIVISTSGAGRPGRVAITVAGLGAAMVIVATFWGWVLNTGLGLFGVGEDALLGVLTGGDLLAELGLTVQVVTVVFAALAVFTAVCAFSLFALIGVLSQVGRMWRSDTAPAVRPDPVSPAPGVVGDGAEGADRSR